MRLTLPSLTLLLLLQHTVATPVPPLDDTIQTRQEPHLRQTDAYNSAFLKRDQTGKPDPSENPLRRDNDDIPTYAFYDRRHRSLGSGTIASEGDQVDLALRAGSPTPTRNPLKMVANAYKGNGKLAFRTVTALVAGATGYSIYNHVKNGQENKQNSGPPPGKRDEQTHVDEEHLSSSHSYDRRRRSLGSDTIANEGDQVDLVLRAGSPPPTRNPLKRVANIPLQGKGKWAFRTVTALVAGATGYTIWNHVKNGQDKKQNSGSAAPAPPPAKRDEQTHLDEERISLSHRDVSSDDPDYIDKRRVSRGAQLGIALTGGVLALGGGWGLYRQVHKGQNEDPPAMAPTAPPPTGAPNPHRKRSVVETDEPAESSLYKRGDAGMDDEDTSPNISRTNEEIDPRMGAIAKYGAAAVVGTTAGFGLLAWVKSKSGQAHRRRSIGRDDALEDDALEEERHEPSQLAAREEVDPRMGAIAKYGAAAVVGTTAGFGLLAWVKSKSGQAHRRRSIAEGAKDESAALVDQNEGRLHSSSNAPPHKVDSAGVVISALTFQGAPDQLQENEVRPIETQDGSQVFSDESEHMMTNDMPEDDRDGHSLEERLSRNHFNLGRQLNNRVELETKIRWGMGAAATAGLGLAAWKIHSAVTKKHDHPADAPGPAAAPTSGNGGHHRRSLAEGEAPIDEPVEVQREEGKSIYATGS